MNFDNLLNEYRQKFGISGSFILRRNDNLEDVLTRNQVPSEWGIYLIYCEGVNECLYIGKGGGPRHRRQSFRERLTEGKHSSGIKLHRWFPRVMVEYGVESLRFDWMVTQRHGVDPTGIRDALKRAHKATFGRPPLENDQR